MTQSAVLMPPLNRHKEELPAVGHCLMTALAAYVVLDLPPEAKGGESTKSRVSFNQLTTFISCCYMAH